VILIVMAVLGVASVPLLRGSFAPLARLELRWLWTAPLALAIQVVITVIAPGGNVALHEAVHVGTYALAGMFLWANRRLPGARLIGAGTICNATAIVLNGGVMPQWGAAARLAGLKLGPGFHNTAVLSHPQLPWLGDVIPLPLPGRLSNVLSIGDLAIFTGMFVLLHVACATSLGAWFERRRVRPRAALAPRDAVRVADAAVTAALTSFQAVLALWQTGASASSPLAHRALDRFQACRAEVSRLAGDDPALLRVASALQRLDRELAGWADGAELSRERERSLVSAERMLTAARSSFLLTPFAEWAPLPAAESAAPAVEPTLQPAAPVALQPVAS
jgi:Family of unknown function (DUF5317)